jgi:hypothetical protein
MVGPISSSAVSDILTPLQIDQITARFNDSIIVSALETFIIALPTSQNNDSVIGAVFKENYQSQTIFNSNKADIVNSNISAAAIFDPISLADVTMLNILLTDKPFDYHYFTNSTNEILSSSVIVTNVQRKNSISNPMNISLFFQPKNVSTRAENRFICAYYDINSSSWNNSSCTPPIYNVAFDRYECICNDTSGSSVEPTTTASGETTNIPWS